MVFVNVKLLENEIRSWVEAHNLMNRGCSFWTLSFNVQGHFFYCLSFFFSISYSHQAIGGNIYDRESYVMVRIAPITRRSNEGIRYCQDECLDSSLFRDIKILLETRRFWAYLGL